MCALDGAARPQGVPLRGPLGEGDSGPSLRGGARGLQTRFEGQAHGQRSVPMASGALQSVAIDGVVCSGGTPRGTPLRASSGLGLLARTRTRTRRGRGHIYDPRQRRNVVRHVRGGG